MTNPSDSIRTLLAAGENRRGDALHLIHKTAGLEIAGAGTRVTNEAWGVLFTERSGITGGQWFRTLAEAQAHFTSRNTLVGA